MKTFAIIAKILAALAAVAGIVYIIATYGDKIVAWAKNLIAGKCADCECDCDCDECDCECECIDEEAAEEEAEEAEEAAEEADFEK